jgi:hypothetical protein
LALFAIGHAGGCLKIWEIRQERKSRLMLFAILLKQILEALCHQAPQDKVKCGGKLIAISSAK